MSEYIVSQRDIEIEWGDCDPADIVFYPNYFRWFDASTAHHFKAAGLPKDELVKRFDVVGFPMVDTRASFTLPSRYGDIVTIKTQITRFGRSSFDVHHGLYRGTKLAVEGFEKRVLVRKSNSGGIEACPIPDAVKALFESGDK
jgi:4-hydroxybenzoyl-CoA thioesterase